MQVGFAKVVEAQVEAQNHRVQALVDKIGQSAPAGSEVAVAALTSAITATNAMYETVHRATQQAVDVANVAAAAASKATQHAVEHASRAAKK